MRRLAIVGAIVGLCACGPAPAAVSVSVPVSVSVSVSAPVSASASVSVSASASVSAPVAVSVPVSAFASAFPAGWYDDGDGSVMHLSERDYALVWGRDVEPRPLLGDGFARDALSGVWVARQATVTSCAGTGALREIAETLEVTALVGGALRFETRIDRPMPDCAPASTTRVLEPIRDAAWTRALDALVADASSPRACAKLARCCQSLRGRERMHTGGMCFQPTSSSIECHDRRLEIATAIHLAAGACVE